MNKVIKLSFKFAYFLLFTLLIVIFSITAIASVDAGEIKTVHLSATEYDYPPFSVTSSGEADGFSVQLLKAVADAYDAMTSSRPYRANPLTIEEAAKEIMDNVGTQFDEEISKVFVQDVLNIDLSIIL